MVHKSFYRNSVKEPVTLAVENRIMRHCGFFLIPLILIVSVEVQVPKHVIIKLVVKRRD